MDQQRRGRILVVDDEAPVRRALAQILEDEGYEVLTAASGEEGVEQAVAQAPDAVFLDIWLPGIDGIDALRHLRERGVAAPVIMISGHGTIETAVRATKLGAYDFVEKPVSLDRVLVVAGNALRHARLERRNRSLRAALRREAEFLGRSPAVERLRTQLAAATDGRPVLLYGERGTGRRLAARWIAMHGARPEGSFLDVQVSALPPERLVRTLYGDPARRALEPGRLALADEGALYLESADALPRVVQQSLLAGVISGEFPVPGAEARVRADLLLVVALATAPAAAVERGDLSADFVAGFAHVMEVPPLRARLDDVPDLAERFLSEISREYARDALTISPEAMAALLCYQWPGNVRELRGVVERLVLLSRGPVIALADLPRQIAGGEAAAEPGIGDTLRRFETTWIQRHVDEAAGDVARAATRLGITEAELRSRMRRLGLP